MTEPSAQKRSLTPKAIFFKALAGLGLRGKLLLALLPSIVVILLATGFASYKVSEGFIGTALERSVSMHTMAMAHEMEQYLNRCRTDLLFLSKGEMAADSMHAQMERLIGSGSIPYLELCYLPASGGKPVMLVRHGNEVRELTPDEFNSIVPTPFGELNRISALKPGRVVPSDILKVTLPMARGKVSNLRVESHVIRFYTYVPGNDTVPPGILFLSVEAARLRDILSWYGSEKSPLRTFPRSDELRFSYFLNLSLIHI
eukprot:TRINITY_DN5682_c0_g1_i2.p3 TRINITY_DN5682_c0_g1~~TRINITY_DN5682_c0_g1_i2.p3  ORF type:complete len:258 (+),score=77.85 TRINITY_DN5682_c0_g1_i2:975-1748(+)